MPPPFPLSIHLIHPEQEACAACRARFAKLLNVHVVQAAYPDVPLHDCFVTAGNSFGIMTAGIDAAVVGFLGASIMQAVQHHILDYYLGEQPVGTAFILPTGNANFPFLCHAPTMRVPGSITGTDAVYCATWAALLAVHLHNRLTPDHPVRTLAFPSMGTGFGRMTYDESARQMAAAYQHFLAPPHRLDWDRVIERHKLIAYDGDKRVVRGG